MLLHLSGAAETDVGFGLFTCRIHEGIDLQITIAKWHIVP